MHSNYTCPQCSTPIPGDRLLGSTIVCSCGWSGDKNTLNAKPANPMIKRSLYGLILLAVAFMVFDGHSWGSHYPEKLMYNVFSTLRMTAGPDDARFAKLCTKLGKHKLARDTYAKAYKKSPKDPRIGFEYGRALTHQQEFETAIITFQAMIGRGTVNSKVMHQYAVALSGGEYTDDATKWFYKALQDSPTNFLAAKDLILHLSESKNYIEALSVLGHYNTTYPKTIKGWKNMSAELKSNYQAYNSEFKIEEMKISGFTKFLHAPVQFNESTEPTVFLVDKESQYLTIDAKYLDSRGIEYTKKGAISLGATSGKEVQGQKILLPELNVGPFVVKNVEAVACDNCAFLLGKKILKRLNFKEAVDEGMKFITLRQ